jgi:hypothetical protein
VPAALILTGLVAIPGYKIRLMLTNHVAKKMRTAEASADLP